MINRLRAPARARHAFHFTPHASPTSRPNPLSRTQELRRPSRRSSSSPLAPSSAAASSSSPSPSAAALPATTPPRKLLLSTPERPLILAFNLSRHELEALRSTGLGWQVVAVVGEEGEGEGEEVGEGSLLDVAAGSVVVVENGTGRQSAPALTPPRLSVRATLLVLPEGCSANDGASEGLASYPAAVDEALVEAGCALCVTGVGVVDEKKELEQQPRLQPLSAALERLGRAHAAAYGIWNPLPRLEREERVPRGATLTTAAFLDAAPWDDGDDDDAGDGENGEEENLESQLLDLSGLAVVDGLLSPEETLDLLLYLTDGDPSCPVEGDKWQRGAVVDHDGGGGEEEEEEEEEEDDDDDDGDGNDKERPPSSWGATPQFIDSLLSSPPPQLLALCSRLRALYSDHFSEILLCPGNDEMSAGLTPLVLNAVTAEDAPALLPHVDADPLRSDPDGAWARAFGLYRNRSNSSIGSSSSGGRGGRGRGENQTRPLLATALLYFQDWPLEDAAETLFFDAEEVGLGLAVRPRAGRVVVSEQDVVHRIVPPRSRRRRKKGGKPNAPPPPRYSLVLKLVLIPKVEGERERGSPTTAATTTSVVLPAWRRGALRLGTAAAAGSGWPLPLA